MPPSFRFFPSRLALAASVSLALLSGCAAPLATVPSGTVPGQAPAASAPASPAAPAPGAPVTPEAIAWTTLEGDASYMGQPLAHATLRVVDALTDAPAHVIAPGGANVIAPGGANVIAPGGLNYRLAGLSEAIGVEAETAQTDAQGRFSVRVAGLAPGQAVRLVVQAGDNGLSTLVLGGQAQPAGYRVHAALGVKISLPSTVTSVASTGVLKATTILKGAEAEVVRGAFVQQVGQVTASGQVTGALTGSIGHGVVSQTDPRTGSAKESEASTQYAEAQADAKKEIQRQLDEMVRKIIQMLKEMEEAKADTMRHMTRVYRVRQSTNPVGTATREQIKALVTQTLDVVRELPDGVTPAQDVVGQVVAENPALDSDVTLTSEQLAAITASLGKALDAAAAKIQAAADAERARLQAEAAAQLAALDAARARDLQGKELYQTSALTQLIQTAGVRAELVEANRKALVATVTAAQDPAKRADTSSTGSGAATVIGVPLPGTGVTADVSGTTLSLTDTRGRRLTIDVTKPDDVAKTTGALAEVFSAPKSSGGHGGASAPVSNTYEVTPLSASAMGDASLKIAFGSQPDAIVPDGDGCWVLMSAAKRVVRVSADGTAEAFDFTTTPRSIAIDYTGSAFVATDVAYERLTPGETARTTWTRGESGTVTMLGYVGLRGMGKLFVSSDGTHLRYFYLSSSNNSLVSATTAVLSPGVTQIRAFAPSFDYLEILTNAVAGAVPVYQLNETPLDLDEIPGPDDELTNQAFGLASPSGVPAFDAAAGVGGGMVGLNKTGQSLSWISGGVLTPQSLAPNQPVALDVVNDDVWVAERGNGGQLRRLTAAEAGTVYGLGGLVPVSLRAGSDCVWVLGDRELKRIVAVDLF